MENQAKWKTGFVWHERYLWHHQNTTTGSELSRFDPSAGLYLEPHQHFENPETKRRIYSLLSVTGLLDELVAIKPREATKEELCRFHTIEYVEKIQTLSKHTGGDGGECCLFGNGSYEIALLSAGGCIAAVDAVLDGVVKNAYALVRPPGHHAESNIGKGFCLFNNIALAALHAQKVRGIKRICILDWDVHHGNGTQKAFYHDDSVLFISIHQDGLYPPRSGSIDEIGEGKGKGYNLNIPLPPGSGEGAYESVFERVVLPAIRSFQPELILISCGFDAAALDPLSHIMLSSYFFGWMTEKVMDVAQSIPSCGGKVIVCHEGGYSAVYVPFCGLAVVEKLSGRKTGAIDPYMEEIRLYPYQSLQIHQDQVISKAEQLVQTYLVKKAK